LKKKIERESDIERENERTEAKKGNRWRRRRVSVKSLTDSKMAGEDEDFAHDDQVC
jgi:hypothetical protein